MYTPIFVLLTALVAGAASSSDKTLVAGAKGAEVVETTMLKIQTSCIIPDDKLFMRRLAFVVSRDGEWDETFRTGYDGGIWQVSEKKFNSVRENLDGVNKDAIKSVLGVDLNSVKWADCRIPMVSAVIARLYMKSSMELQGDTFSYDVTKQGNLFSDHYRPGEDPQDFIDDVNSMDTNCDGIMDILFVLDSSSTVGSVNFEKMKTLTSNVVSSFDTSVTRVAILTYSTTVKEEFGFVTNRTKEQLVAAIANIKYRPGSLNTHLALARLPTVFSGSDRSDAANIAIMITDGDSNYPMQTAINGMKALSSDINLIAVSVGDKVSPTTMESMSSEPKCLNMLQVDYSEIESLKSAIVQRACNFVIIFDPAIGKTEKTLNLKSGRDRNCMIKVTDKGVTVVVKDGLGKVTFFVSNYTFPCEIFYDDKVSSTPGHPGVMYLPKPKTLDPTGTIFCNILGDDTKRTRPNIKVTVGDSHHCDGVVCLNGGTCVDNSYGYYCKCPIGWEGKHCEIPSKKPCMSKPCEKGTCTDNADGTYTCNCWPGWTGKHCNEASAACKVNPCVHGVCTNVGDGYECCCEHGYTGTNCETEIDECYSNPCMNGATCVDHTNRYECECAPGYVGTNCEHDTNNCVPDPCVNAIKCTDKVDDYECTCKPGWEGKDCEDNIDECQSSPCENGGSCKDGVNRYDCTCVAGYTGIHCETDIDDCSPDPCVNAIKCTDKVNDYECTCKPGWEGKTCEDDIDECASNPCVHGNCEDLVNRYKCHCLDGYTGTDCETEINECDSEPCQNGGSCVDHVNKYTCTCAAGYTGVNCETNIDDCKPHNPCVHGNCTDKVFDFSCTCEPGWTGKRCEIDIPECASDPCVHGACEDLTNEYICHCQPGYTGRHCETNIDECESEPCQNGGTCKDGNNMYVCECPPGYHGDHCEHTTPPCQDDPCDHGTCVDIGHGDYVCKCQPGWTGKNCDCVIDHCATNPCVNGVCKNEESSYKCICNIGYIGPLCDKGITEPTVDPDRTAGPPVPTADPGPGTGYNCAKGNSPCTAANRDAGHYYFTHTNKYMFVQCDNFGRCFDMPCAPGTQWDQSKLTCDHIRVTFD